MPIYIEHTGRCMSCRLPSTFQECFKVRLNLKEKKIVLGGVSQHTERKNHGGNGQARRNFKFASCRASLEVT